MIDAFAVIFGKITGNTQVVKHVIVKSIITKSQGSLGGWG